MDTNAGEALNADRACALIDKFFADGQELHFERRQPLIPVGLETEHVYWITEGIVSVYSYGERGLPISYYLYKKNEVFPVMHLYGDGLRGLGFAAFNDVTVRRRTLKEFIAFLDQEPHALPAILIQQNEAYDRIMTLHIGSAERRLARWLITLGKRFGECKGNHYTINLPITMQELASTVRLSRESTGKLIAKFEDNGAVVCTRKRIFVYPDKLKALENED